MLLRYSGKLSVAIAACSASIWSQRARAARVGLGRLETSDTELIVQRLTEALWATDLRAGLRVFPPREEADKGADLEIWLGLEEGLSIGFTIQAKRTALSRTRLLNAKTILQKSGTRGRNSLQLDDLISHGKKVEANPVHLLYSGWDDPAPGDPLVRGRGMPAQYGASVLPTWWFRAARSWGNRVGVGQTRVDILSDVILPFEWVFKPEDIRPPSARAQRAHPWFTTEYPSAGESVRTRQFVAGLDPFDRRSFGDVASHLTHGLGLPSPSAELVDYALLGIGMGSAEYGPSAATGAHALRKPYDFGMSRNPPAYVPLDDLGRSRMRDFPGFDDRGPAPDDDPAGRDGEAHHDESDGPSSSASRNELGARTSRVDVDVVDDPEQVIEWQWRSRVEALPRVVLAID